MEESRVAKRSMQIYYAMPSNRTGVVFSVDYLNSISSGKPLLLSFTFALDWIAHLVCVSRISFALTIFSLKTTIVLLPVKIETFDQEISAYHSWLKSLNEQHGVIRERKMGPF